MRMIQRFVALLLLFCFLCSSLSCVGRLASIQNENVQSTQRLLVEEVDITYTDKEKAAISARVTNLFVNYMQLLFPQTEITASNKLVLRSFIAEQIFPILEENCMTHKEMDGLCSQGEQRLQQLSEIQITQKPAKTMQIMTDGYRQMVQVVGNQRGGRICFELMDLYLSQEIAEYEYLSQSNPSEENCQEWERLKELRKALCEDVGKDTFADMIAFVVYGSALLAEVPQNVSLWGGEGIRFGDAELLMLLQKQSAYLDVRSVSEECWRAVFSIFHHMLEDMLADVEQGSVSSALWSAEGVDALACAMPNITQLYTQLIEVLTVEDIVALRSADDAKMAQASSKLWTELQKVENGEMPPDAIAEIFLSYIEGIMPGLADAIVEGGEEICS